MHQKCSAILKHFVFSLFAYISKGWVGMRIKKKYLEWPNLPLAHMPFGIKNVTRDLFLKHVMAYTSTPLRQADQSLR